MLNFVFLLVSSVAFSAPSFQAAGGAADLLNQTTTPVEIENSQKNVNVSMTCKNEDGKVFKDGEEGYLHCLDMLKLKRFNARQNAQDESKTDLGFTTK